ncbi:high mobility group box domain-containing protein, partial [Blyttiomyces helicus]
QDPNAPKAPMTSYLLFCQDVRDRIKQEYPSWSQTDIAKEMGRRWKDIGDDGKRPYEERALHLREDYNQAMAAYRSRV